MRSNRNPQPPELNPRYSALTLADIRELRHELEAEESRVSYWRRIIQARVDLLTKGGNEGDLVERLTSALAETGNVHKRLASLSVIDASEIEALPDLRRLWTTVVDIADGAAVSQFVAALSEVETQLSTLRVEIHRRLDEATGQLIARYRAEPTLALSALPDIGVLEDLG